MRFLFSWHKPERLKPWGPLPSLIHEDLQGKDLSCVLSLFAAFSLIPWNVFGGESGFHTRGDHAEASLSSCAVTLTGLLIAFPVSVLQNRDDQEGSVSISWAEVFRVPLHPPAVSLLPWDLNYLPFEKVL